MLTAAIFDLDGTLIDSAQCAIEATLQTFANEGLPPPSTEKVLDLMGIPIEQSFKMMGADILSNQEFSDLLASFRGNYRALATNSIRPFPGIPELLTDLKSLGKKIAVATSKSSTVARENLKAAGLLASIDLIIGSDRVQNYKPYPDSIFMALAELKIPPSPGALMTGDAVVDIEMGRAAGVRTCAVTWGAHSAHQLQNASPDFISSSVVSLRQTLFERMAASEEKIPIPREA